MASFFLSASECNAQGELSLPVLTEKIIDIATDHANSLGIGNPAMEHLGFGWVLSRLAIEMTRYPKVNEKYSITTWIESFNRHFSVRNFEITDGEGSPIGYATSVWMVLNWHTRENAGTSHLNLDASLITGRTAPIAKFGKHAPVSPEEGFVAGERKFAYTDLDFYRHVNTVRYVAMILDSFSLEQMDDTFVKRIELAFMREGKYGEFVRLMRKDDELQTSFWFSDALTGTGLVSASLLRRPRTHS